MTRRIGADARARMASVVDLAAINDGRARERTRSIHEGEMSIMSYNGAAVIGARRRRRRRESDDEMRAIGRFFDFAVVSGVRAVTRTMGDSTKG